MLEVDIRFPRFHFELQVQEHFPIGITGIFGPSGAGKTSLLHAISGTEHPKEGSIKLKDRVLFDSENGINVAIEKRKIGYVFQEGRLFPHLNVEKNLKYGYKESNRNEISFEEIIDLLDIKTLLRSRPSQISGGEKQRVALGRSLLSSPDILLLDEPFSAVDLQLRKQILPFILKIQKRIKIPILVVSHDLPDLLKLTKVIFVMEKGRCLGFGEYPTLLKNEAIARIFGEQGLINSIEVEVDVPEVEGAPMVLQWGSGENQVQIKCKGSDKDYQKGQRIKIFIHADDIALSTHRLENVTLQNQLEGEVTEIIPRGHSQLCIVNVGFSLVVEITSESQKRLQIQIGSKVWCLFKSVAIDFVG